MEERSGNHAPQWNASPGTKQQVPAYIEMKGPEKSPQHSSSVWKLRNTPTAYCDLPDPSCETPDFLIQDLKYKLKLADKDYIQ